MLLAHWGRREWVDRLVLGIFLPLLGYLDGCALDIGILQDKPE